MAVDIKLPEVLAPAGSLEGLYAAVNAGCDAVYIGGSRFGARAYADNPGEDDMIKAIEDNLSKMNEKKLIMKWRSIISAYSEQSL